ncbi:ribbon-helix-helix domain-containing protein [Candidatus Methylobacter favarea]|uniref:ribbon-helix-helix domain-containing protein n=1 Tax=Candidatus Methylobacter favarea TaxID=2707345 RepID=UPI00157CF4E1|nr:ribbon-helix-helix domain-containing protein [Candidatus Methylobacter favarea]
MANRKKEKKLVRVTVSVDPDDYASINHLSRSSGFSALWLIRRAMQEFLERRQEEKNINIDLRH